ncbi:hypothetical protein [Ensifer adhaerens]|uniref:hypothetical protein n=1 Tax=Ensifer adhaerens TaxID=106592 RepID=UPI00202F141B|nr:hypothetical protein [Ensifer adhaerens]
MLTDAEFERTIQGFSPEAQDAMRRDRDRHIAEAKTDIRRGKPVVTRGVAALEDAEDLRAQRQALHNGATVTSQPKGAAAPTAPASTLNKFAAYIGEKFRDFEEAALQAIGKDLAEAELKIDGKIAALRRDFISSVRSRASELARTEVENRIAHEIEKALKDHRQERIALAKRVEELADQIERMRSGYR